MLLNFNLEFTLQTNEHTNSTNFRDSNFRDLAMAQYGPEVPSTFGVTMPVDQVDAARAANPTIATMIKEMEIASKSENN